MTSPRRIAGALLLGAAFLLLEIRFEHREVLGETWRGWIPIGYAALLFAAGIPAWVAWARGGRKLLLALFAPALAVGLLGAWFHSGGRPDRALVRVASAWTRAGATKAGSGPPPLAPMAFCGLGLLGVLACASDDRRNAIGE